VTAAFGGRGDQPQAAPTRGMAWAAAANIAAGRNSTNIGEISINPVACAPRCAGETTLITRPSTSGPIFSCG